MQKFNQAELDQMVPQLVSELKALNNSGGWEQISQGKVEGFKKVSEGSCVVSKGSTVLNVPFEKVVQFMSEDSFVRRLNSMCIQFKVLHEKPGNYKITYMEIKTPFPFDNRYTVSLQTTKQEGDIFYMVAKSCNFPHEAKSNYVLSNTNIAGWIIQRKGNQTKITSIADIDPKGHVPDFVKGQMANGRVKILKQFQSTMKKYGY